MTKVPDYKLSDENLKNRIKLWHIEAYGEDDERFNEIIEFVIDKSNNDKINNCLRILFSDCINTNDND